MRSHRVVVVVALLVSLIGVGVVPVGGAGAVPPDQSRAAVRARDLAPLASQAPPERTFTVSKNDFSNPPPRDGDVAKANAERKERRAEDGASFVKKTSRLTKRSAFSDVYKNADGTHTELVHAGVANMQDGDGKWKPIDLTLEKRTDDRWAPKASPLPVSFSDDASGPLMAVQGPDWSVGFSLEGASAKKAAANRSKVKYPKVAKGADLDYEVLNRPG